MKALPRRRSSVQKAGLSSRDESIARLHCGLEGPPFLYLRRDDNPQEPHLFFDNCQVGEDFLHSTGMALYVARTSWTAY